MDSLVKSIGNPAGIGKGTGFGLRERDRDGIGLGHYRLRANEHFSFDLTLIKSIYISTLMVLNFSMIEYNSGKDFDSKPVSWTPDGSHRQKPG